jgi:hypothetical protein
MNIAEEIKTKNGKRFKVFQRDGFTCQYCGGKVPSVILEVDHIIPKAKGGADDIDNLITSCFECNRGKRDRSLDNVPPKISENLINIPERRKQLKEFYQFQEEKIEFYSNQLERIKNYWAELWPRYWRLDRRKICGLKGFIKEFDYFEIEEALDIAKSKIEDPESSFSYFCGILQNKRKERNG